MFLDSLMGFFSTDVAMDLGTANTLVYVRGRGIVLNEPSVVAVDKASGRVLAVGSDAKLMLGPYAGRDQRHPPAQGRSDRGLRGHRGSASRVRAQGAEAQVPGAPSHHHLRAVGDHRGREARRASIPPVRAGVASRCCWSPSRSPRQSAWDCPVDTPTGNMVVDIGGGTTEIAVIALNGIVTKTSIRVGGDEMDEAIANYAKKAYNMLIGEQTAERIKIEIGSAFPLSEEMDMEIKGRDLVRGIPRTLRVSSVEIREALQEPIGNIVNAAARIAGAHAARAGRRHRRPRHLPHRRRRAAARPRPPPARGDEPQHPRRRRTRSPVSSWERARSSSISRTSERSSSAVTRTSLLWEGFLPRPSAAAASWSRRTWRSRCCC